jgi:Uma2 family endonuclease
MEAVIERLSRSPRLPHIVRELDAFWKREQKARKFFYDSIEDGQKVEFINGKTIMHSPDTLRHLQARKRITVLLDTFVAQHRLGTVLDGKALICLTRNDYMPDVVVFLGDSAKTLTPEQLHFPAPELAVEVLSPSTARRNRGVKFNDYAAHGVRDYWIVDPEARAVERYRLDSFGKYELAWKHSGDELVLSEVLAGFKTPARAFFDGAAHLAALRKLLK